MNNNDFRQWSYCTADWAAVYRATLDDLPVRALLLPAATIEALPVSAPEAAGPMVKIFTELSRRLRCFCSGMNRIMLGILMPMISLW